MDIRTYTSASLRFLIAILILLSTPARASVQGFDYLILKGDSLRVRIIGTSILQYYYSQKKIEYPFESTSTGNYRGHVATWVVSNSKLYLKSVSVREQTYAPQHFNISSYKASYDSADLILADWFSGVIECWSKNWYYKPQESSTFYFQIRYGVVVGYCEAQGHTPAQRTINQGSDETVINAGCRNLRNTYDRYLNYDSPSGDYVSFRGREWLFELNSIHNSLLEYYSRDELKWPFNWENEFVYGVPNSTWSIQNDSLMLLSVKVRCDPYDSLDDRSIDLQVLFPGTRPSAHIFASWITGIFLIDTRRPNPPYGFPEPTKSDICKFVRIENGMLKEQCTVPFDYFYHYINDKSKKLSQRAREIIAEYHRYRL